LLQQWCWTPEQRLYEGIRPIVLFGFPPAERAQETGLAAQSLGRTADAFDTHGIISLFRPTKAQREDHHLSLPVAMRQLIVDLKAEYADSTDGEIAAICAIQFQGRRPSRHTVKAVPEARRFATPYHSLQGRLWELDETMWHLAKRLSDYAPGRKQRRLPQPTQLPLGDAFLAPQEKAEGNDHGSLQRERKDQRGRREERREKGNRKE
jgi:hypothetical protein